MTREEKLIQSLKYEIDSLKLQLSVAEAMAENLMSYIRESQEQNNGITERDA